MEKHNNLVTVTLDDTIFPDTKPFVTTINNLIFILRKWHYYKGLLVDTIKVVLKDDQAQVIDSRGSLTVKNIQKIVYKWDEKNHIYSILTCEGETAYLLERFLAYCNSKTVDLYIDWALKPNEYNITQNFITLEKDENYILISSTLTDQPKKTFVRLLHTDFLSLLEKWKTFNAMEAHEVTILEEDGKVKIKCIE